MRRDSDPSVQVGTMRSHSADRHFQRFLYGFCEGCSAAKRGPLRPRFAPLAVRWVVYLTAHFRAHSSIPAAVTGTPDRDDTAIAAVDAGAQHGRKWPPEPTSHHAVRQGVRIRVFENSDPSEQVGMVRSDGADRRFHLFCEGCRAAKHGPLRPRFTLRAVKRVVWWTAHFRGPSPASQRL